MATIEQRVRGLVCWVAEVSLWSGRLLKCARRQADVLVWTRDLDLEAFNPLDGRRIEVIVDTWHSWRWTPQLVAPLHGDGRARRNTATTSGVALQAAHRAKETTHPELSGEGGRVRLVVLAAEVGGRWSQETVDFPNALAKARAQESPQILQGRVRTPYVRRWKVILACSLARSLSVSLLERRPVPGTGGDILSAHEVVRTPGLGDGPPCSFVCLQRCTTQRRRQKKTVLVQRSV